MLKNKTSRGVMLIEALVALIVVSLGMLGISKLQTHLIAGSGDSKARAEATALAEGKLEKFRNNVVSGQYDDVVASSSPLEVDGDNANFEVEWTVPSSENGLKQVTVTVVWNDRHGVGQSVALSSLIAWEDPLSVARLDDPSSRAAAIRPPTGEAQRGEGSYDGLPAGAESADDISGVYIYETDSGVKELLDGYGNILLSLPTLDGDVRSFVTIRGRVYFDDQTARENISADQVDVRLSSEGLCFEGGVSEGSPRNFEYICYVGPGWYGNVGILMDTQSNAPKVCVGTAGEVDDGGTTSFHAAVVHTRSYRGFRDSDGTLWSTGVASGFHYPPSGQPRLNGDSLEHHFLLTRSNQSCGDRVALLSEEFSQNYGGHVCIDPHNSSDDVVCPYTWPGFPGSDLVPGQCLNAIGGGMIDRQGSVSVVSTSPEISCATGGQLGNRNFSCQVIVEEHTEIVLRNESSHPQNSYCYEATVLANCSSQEFDFQDEENESIVQCED